MWPFDIFAKRRAREARMQREEEDRRMQQIKDSIEEAARRRQREHETLMSARAYRAQAAGGKPTQRVSAVPKSVSSTSTSGTVYDDSLSPLNPLSPTYVSGSHLSLVTSDEPRQSSSHCSASSSYSSGHDSGSSHSHSSHDHGCSSSSYDSGSSSSSSDW